MLYGVFRYNASRPVQLTVFLMIFGAVIAARYGHRGKFGTRDPHFDLVLEQSDRQAGKQAGRQLDRQSDRQSDR